MATFIRQAKEQDIPQIHAIYRHYALNTVLTFLANDPPLSYTADKFAGAQARALPFLVAVKQDTEEDTHGGNDASKDGNATEKPAETVCGYASASAFRGHMLSYAPTVELSLFLLPDHRSRGIGSRLLEVMIAALKETRHRAGEFIGDSNYEVLAEGGAGSPVRHVLSVMAVDPEGKDGGEGLRDWYVQRGFVERGRLQQAGYKMGKWIDVIYLQYSLW